GRLGDREERRPPHQEPERNLARRGVVRGGDLLQEAPSGRARAGETPMPERAVGDHADAVPLAPGQHRVLDSALLQMVEDLIADETALAGDRPGGFEV